MSGTDTGTAQQAGQEVTTEDSNEIVLPHMAYDDPPGGMSPGDYKAALWQGVRMFGDEDIFTIMLLQRLVPDLVEEHHVDEEMAVAAVEKFAKQVYAEATAAPAEQ